MTLCVCFNTLRPRQNGRHIPDDIFKCIFLNETIWITIKFSLKFVRKGPINNIPALVQIMAWRRPGDKPLSEPTLVSLLMYICVTRPQWVKEHFDTRYLVFYNPSPPRMFLSLDLLSEYRIQHGANWPLHVISSCSTWIFCRGVSGFATDSPCGVWCRGLTTYLLHVGPPFENRILNNSWAVGLT